MPRLKVDYYFIKYSNDQYFTTNELIGTARDCLILIAMPCNTDLLEFILALLEMQMTVMFLKLFQIQKFTAY